MSNYTKTTNFGAKDTLPSGDSQKIIRGTEFDTEFNNVATAIATKLEVDGSNNLAISGTFSSTKLIPTGGTATGNGLYLPAANTLALSTNGTERVRVDSSGNLGLGVTPGAWGTTSFQIGVTGFNNYGSQSNLYNNTVTDASNNPKYISSLAASAYRQVSGAHSWLIAPSGTAGNAITFTQAMTLDSSGNLGLGTTTFAYSAGNRVAFEVNGSTDSVIAVKAGNTASAYLQGASTQATLSSVGAIPLIFGTNSSERMRLDSSGNLGIGITSPLSKINAVGGIRSSDSSTETNAIQMSASATAGTIETRYGTPLVFGTNATERARIDTSGNLGLGVTPSAWDTGKVMQFSTGGAFVFGDSAQFITGVNAYYQSAWKYTGTGAATRYESVAGVHRWYTAPSGTAGNAITFTQAMTLDANGLLLVGTTSPINNGTVEVTGTSRQAFVAKVTDNANSLFQGFDSSGANRVFQVTGSGIMSVNNIYAFGTTTPLVFGTNSTERARIDSSGNFGIGTSSPSVKLDIRGIAHFFSGASGTFNHINIGRTGSEARIGVAAATNDFLTGVTAGDSVFYSVSTGNSWYGTASSGAAVFSTNNTERARIKSTGQLRFVPLSADPAGAETGDVYYNSTSNKLKVYNGTAWVDLH